LTDSALKMLFWAKVQTVAGPVGLAEPQDLHILAEQAWYRHFRVFR
jgi:hypothetical protein